MNKIPTARITKTRGRIVHVKCPYCGSAGNIGRAPGYQVNR